MKKFQLIMTFADYINTHGLTCKDWHANGLGNKIPELKHYISQNKIDIMLLNETKLKKLTITVRGYHTHIPHRPNSRHGGLAFWSSMESRNFHSNLSVIAP